MSPDLLHFVFGQISVKEDGTATVVDLDPLGAAKGELESSKARLWTANANLRRIRPLAEAVASGN